MGNPASVKRTSAPSAVGSTEKPYKGAPAVAASAVTAHPHLLAQAIAFVRRLAYGF